LNTPPLSTTYSGPSYPVFVDPVGVAAYSGSPVYANYVGGMNAMPAAGIRRVPASFAATPSLAIRWFTLLDDIDFDETGVPRNAPLLQREGAFSWACLCQMERYQAPNATPPAYTPGNPPIDVTVVVYHKRSLDLTTGFTPAGETAYAATSPGGRIITLSWNPAAGESKPALRKSWLLDATMVNATGQPEPHGFFYRVILASEPGSNGPNSMDLEADRDVQKPGTLQWIVVMEGVVEVFEKGP